MFIPGYVTLGGIITGTDERWCAAMGGDKGNIIFMYGGKYESKPGSDRLLPRPIMVTLDGDEKTVRLPVPDLPSLESPSGEAAAGRQSQPLPLTADLRMATWRGPARDMLDGAIPYDPAHGVIEVTAAYWVERKQWLILHTKQVTEQKALAQEIVSWNGVPLRSDRRH